MLPFEAYTIQHERILEKKSAFIRRSPECEQSHDRESNQELDHQDAVHLKKERKYLFYVLAYKVYKST